MKAGKKTTAKPQPIARDLPARKNPRGGTLAPAYKLTPVLSSPPSSLQVQDLQYKLSQ